MDPRDVARHWNENAAAWLELEQAGYNLARDFVNEPAFLELLPDVAGLTGLDVGCGPGFTTRRIAERSGRLVAIDVAARFLAHAAAHERNDPRGIRFVRGSAIELPFADASFDFAVGTMSFMDIPELERVTSEVRRVLKGGGFLQFSILHPCFNTFDPASGDGWVRDSTGRKVALRLSQYWDREREWVEEWTFGAAPLEVRERTRRFRVPRFDRTLAEWLEAFAREGFVLERVAEPRASDEQLRAEPRLYDTRLLPWFLLMRWRKA